MLGPFGLLSFYQTLYHLNSSNGTAFLSPDGSKLVILDPFSNVFVYSFSNFALLHKFTPQNNVTSPGITEKVTFNAASTLIVIETDNINPIMIMNLTSFATVYIAYINDVILSALFFNKTDRYLLVLGNSSNYMIDLTTSIVYQETAVISNSISGSSFNNKVYVCHNNSIK